MDGWKGDIKHSVGVARMWSAVRPSLTPVVVLTGSEGGVAEEGKSPGGGSASQCGHLSWELQRRAAAVVILQVDGD